MSELGILMIIGGLFGAALFSINVHYGSKPAIYIVCSFIAIAIIGIVLFFYGEYRYKQAPLYEYQIQLHYIDGGTKTLRIETKQYPRINASRGTYWFECGNVCEIGVVRFDILSKNIINKIEP